MTERHRESGEILFSEPDVTEDDVAAVGRVLRGGWLTTGNECQLLEEGIAAYLGMTHVVGVSSCTAALEIAMASLGLPLGARVAVPTWTFISTALAAHRVGAVPIWVDVDESTLNISPSSLAAVLDDGVDAVVAVHFGGVPVDRAIHELCHSAGVPVVEDTAHAFGSADWRGRALGRGSVASCLSFYATKNLTSAEGGAIATDDHRVASFARSHRLHGLSNDAWVRYKPGGHSNYDLLGPGIKANLPDVLAALARSQLARFPEMQARRRQWVLRYRKQLAGSGLRFVPEQLALDGADHLMVVVLPEGVDRETVVKRLRFAGIGSSIHFRPLHTFRWFDAHAVSGPGGLAMADHMAPRVLSLPLHVRLSDDQVDRVCQELRSAVEL